MRLHPLTVFILILGAAAAAPCSAAWSRRDLGPAAGSRVSIALDPAGQPHISYMDDSNPVDYVLRHATSAGGKWRTEIVDRGDVGWNSAIAVDSAGHLHLAYQDSNPSYALKYAMFDGQSWYIQTLEAGGFSISLALDDQDHPGIVHINESSEVRYVHFDGNAWLLETIAYGWNQARTSLALDDSGTVHFCFSNSWLPRQLYYGTNDSGSWQVDRLDDGFGCSLALDGFQRPRIAYYDEQSQELRFASFNGSAWATEIIDWGPISSPALVLDASDHPRITYGYYLTVGANGVEILGYAHDDGTGWLYDLVDFKNCGYDSSIALDGAGAPHLAYWRGKGHSARLQYAHLLLPELRGGWAGVGAVASGTGFLLQGTLDISNGGNLKSKALSIAFYLSDDTVYDIADEPVGAPEKIKKLSPGASAAISFSATVAASPSGRYLIAVLDPANKVAELDEGNNLIVALVP